MLKRAVDKIAYIFGLIVIVFIPFQTLAQNLLEKKLSPGLSFWLAHFYEPVILLLLLLMILSNLFMTDFSKWKGKAVPVVILAFGLVSVFLLASGLGRGLEGFRFDFIGVIFFLLFSLLNFSKDKKQSLLSTYIVVAVVAATLAVVERFLPLHYWSALDLNNFGWGSFSVVTTYQSSAFLAGPNQLASYLLPAFFLLVVGKLELLDAKSRWLKILKIIVLILFVAAIILTFSRAAFVGLAIGAIGYVIFVEKRWTRRGIYFLVLLALGVGLAYFYHSGGRQARDLFTHGSSGQQHLSAFQSSYSEIKTRVGEPVKLIFGSGIGDAGPAALKYGEGFVSESWYIQLLLELGIAGLLLWLYFIFATLMRLNKLNNLGLFLALISVSGAAIFLHTWADNPALAITLFILIGSRNYENPN